MSKPGNLWLLSNLSSKQFFYSSFFLHSSTKNSKPHFNIPFPLTLLYEFHLFCTQTMPQSMAVTHVDLEPSRKRTDLSSKPVAFFVVLTLLLGLFCFILCLTAEATRSEATWVTTDDKGKRGKSECAYSGSGKVPLLCCACAFVGLAIFMLVGHSYMLIAVAKMPETPLITWDPASVPPKSLSWQLGFFYITTWICFAVGEVLLLAGITVESGHLQNWDKPKPSCLLIKEGLLSAAGVFALITVFLAIGLYVTALHAQRIYQETVNARRQVLETSALYSSPPTLPQRQLMTVARENPMSTHNHQPDQLPFSFPTPFHKSLNNG